MNDKPNPKAYNKKVIELALKFLHTFSCRLISELLPHNTRAQSTCTFIADSVQIQQTTRTRIETYEHYKPLPHIPELSAK